MAPLDWLIVGSGIHGCHLAVRLLATRGVARERLRLIDVHQQPLASWHHCTSNTGMRYLRSPSVHHLGVAPFGLARFAGERGRPLARFREPYRRPGLELFRAHCAHVLDSLGVGSLCERGRVEAVSERGDHLVVTTERGAIATRRLVLALGPARAPRLPEWMELPAPARVHHVFEPSFHLDEVIPPDGRAGDGGDSADQHIVVVGGGISAVQLALTLHRRGVPQVTLLARHAVKISMFDSSPGWIGPKYLAGFWAEPDLTVRRQIIHKARRRGTVPKELDRQLRRAVGADQIAVRRSEVSAARVTDTGAISIALSTGETLRCDRIIAATGFAAGAPDSPLVPALTETLDLRRAPCGYPVVDTALRWHPRIHLMGGLAELELGPVARNIAGAREAAQRIAAAA